MIGEAGCVDELQKVGLECMGGGEDAEVFLVMPDLTVVDPGLDWSFLVTCNT